MPQIGKMKFSYDKAGKARYQQIKKALNDRKPGGSSKKRPLPYDPGSRYTRPINGVKPRPIGKPHLGIKKKLR